MIPIYDSAGELHPLTQYDSFSITHEENGFDDCLSFRIDPRLPEYKWIAEENRIVYGGNNWIIKKISDDAVEAFLDLDELKLLAYKDYYSGSLLLTELIRSLLPDYTVLNGNLSSIRRTIAMDFATPYEILKQAMSTYKVFFEFQTEKKIITVHPAEQITSSGEYVTDELNLRSLSFRGETTQFATRLYAYGAEGMTFADINGGKPYVENHTYADKIVCAYWSDERYTIPENLLADAQAKLDELAVPVRSYECDVVDLAKMSPEKYGFLAFVLHRYITLIDTARGLRVAHKIVSYTEYPDEPDRNKVVLSSAARTVGSFVSDAIGSALDGYSGGGGSGGSGGGEIYDAEFDRMNQKIIAVTALLAHSTGTYSFTDGDGNFYLADNENLQEAKSVWVFNKDGMGHSSTGVEGPYTTAWTFDASFLAEQIDAIVIRAEKIVTGILTDKKGLNYWNLDTGEFRLSAHTQIGDGTLSEHMEALSSSIIVDVNGMISDAKSGMVSSDEFGEYKTLMESTITQTGDEIRFEVSSRKEAMSNLENSINQRFAEQRKYIRFKIDKGVLVGEENNDLEVRIDAGLIGFEKKGTLGPSWDGDILKTKNLEVEVTKYAKFGSLAWVPRTDKSLHLKAF